MIKERLKARDILLKAYPKLQTHQPTLDYVFVQDCKQSLGNPFCPHVDHQHDMETGGKTGWIAQLGAFS